MGNELCAAVGCDDHAARYPVGDRRTEVGSREVQAQVDAGSDACTGGDVAVVYVEDVRLDEHIQMAALQFGGVLPVGRGLQSVK